MLGYSDSTKESGPLAAAWMLYRAQERLADVVPAARRPADAVPRPGRRHRPRRRAHEPGHPGGRPGSLQGRLKLTEQGEVIADRYANPYIALRHLEQVTNAVLVASAPGARRTVARRRAAPGTALMERPRRDVATGVPVAGLGGPGLRDLLPGRHAHRGAGGHGHRVATGGAGDSGRAPRPGRSCAPSRGSSPGRSRAPTCPAGMASGSALAGYMREHGEAGLARLRELYLRWPFFASVLDNAEMSIAKADMQVARRYAGLAPTRESRTDLAPHPRASTGCTRDSILAVNQRAAHHGRAAGPAALDRAAQPVRRLAVGAAGAAAGPAARAAAGRPGARRAACASSTSRSAASPPGSRTRASDRVTGAVAAAVLSSWLGIGHRARWASPPGGFRTTAAIREAPWGPRPIPSSRIPSHRSDLIPRSTSHGSRGSSGS